MKNRHLQQKQIRHSLTTPTAETVGEATTVPGSAGSVVAKPIDPPSMASSVTRHALNPPPEPFRYLLCGIDSLDLGLYVDWNKDWPEIRKFLEDSKDKAQGTEGLLEEITSTRKYIFLPGGKRPNYRYHLQFNEYHLYIAKSDQAKTSPNVYLSINAETLWLKGMEHALDLVVSDLKFFGGEVARIVPSRLDLCADFKLSDGLTLPFLQQHAVCRSRDLASHIKGETLETCYFGSASAPIRLRIYDKGKEVLKKGTKLWLRELWRTEDLQNVWRVEFQLRRPVLKQFKVNSIQDIWRKLGEIWHYLTGEWFSLRLSDNDKTERRTIPPLWLEVQACSQRLGDVQGLQREIRGDSLASAQWYIAHIAGCLPSFAARVNVRDYREAILKLGEELYHHWGKRDFESEFLKRAIKLGVQINATGGEHGND